MGFFLSFLLKIVKIVANLIFCRIFAALSLKFKG